MGLRWNDTIDGLKTSSMDEIGPLMKDTNPSKWEELQEAARNYLKDKPDIAEILGLL